MKRFYSLTLILLAVLSISLNAQYVRRVIVEEATNASCGPCAAQNPTFQKWLSNHLDRVIPVIYHAWWPGPNDPMYLYDTIMNKTRIQYYGITGVPSGRINGKIATPSGSYYAGAVADTVALTNELKQTPFYSFISVSIIDFNFNTNDGSGSVKIEIASDIPLSNKFLRVAICEEHHYYENAGTNGEKDFYYLVRQMLPNARGTLFNIAAGESQTFEFTFNVDPSFTDDLYAVAFIQDEANKEILQGNWTKSTNTTEPDFYVMLTTDNLVNVGNTNDVFQYESLVLNNTPEEVIFDLSISGDIPSDWTAKIDKDLTQLVAPPKSKANVTVIVQIGSTPTSAEVLLNLKKNTNNTELTTSSMKVYHSGIQRLHILGGEQKHSIMPIIESSFGKGYVSDISLDDMSANASKFNSLKTIIWDGSTSGDFTASSANIITNAISNNRNIFILGGRITPGLISNGILPYFGLAFIAYCREGYYSPYSVTLAGVPGDPITGDFGNNIQGNLINYLLPLYRIVNNQTTSPIMTFAKSADSIFAVKVEFNKSRAIVLGMNPFILSNQTIREKLITRSLLWLEGISNVGLEELDVDISISPNPASNIAYLTMITKIPTENIVVRLHDIQGRTLRTIFEGTLNEGTITIPISLAGLPPQTIYVTIESKIGSKSIKLIKAE